MNQQDSNNFYDLDKKYFVKEDLVELKIISGNGHDVDHDIYWEGEHYRQDNLKLGLGADIKSKSLRINSNCTKTSPSEFAIIKYKFEYRSIDGNDEDEFEVPPKEFDADGRIIVKARFKFK